MTDYERDLHPGEQQTIRRGAKPAGGWVNRGIINLDVGQQALITGTDMPRKKPSGGSGGGTATPPDPPPDPIPPSTDQLGYAGLFDSGAGVTGGSDPDDLTIPASDATLYTVSTFGQLKTALQASGKRFIKVVGSTLMDAGNTTIGVTHGDFTLYGGAFTRSVKRLHLIIKAGNFVILEMRLRPGSNTATAGAAIMLNPGGTNTMAGGYIANCHLAWGWDASFNIFNRATDVTIQNCIIGPGLINAASPGYGMSMHGDNPARHERISRIRNFLPHNPRRNLRAYAVDGVEDVNNVVYNWDDKLANMNVLGGSWVANMAKKGPGTQGSNEFLEMELFGDDSSYFASSVYAPRTGDDANLMWDEDGNPISLSSGDFIFHGTGNPLGAPYGGALHNVTPVIASDTLMDAVVAAAGTSTPDSLELDLKDQYTNGTWDGNYYSDSGPLQPSWP